MANAEEFISQVVKEFNSDISVNPSTPFYDLFINQPANNTLLPALLELEEQTQNNRSLTNTGMSESEYDALAINMLKERITGTQSIVTARSFFTAATVITLPIISVFSIGDIEYTPNRDITYITEDFLLEPVSGRYFIDVVLVSKGQGINTVPAVGSILDTPYTVNEHIITEILSILSPGIDPETNEDFFTRMQREAGTTLPVHDRGVSAFLSDNFAGIVRDYFFAGFDDAEVITDKVTKDIPKRILRIVVTSPINLNYSKEDIELRYVPSSSYYYLFKEDLTISINDWQAQGDLYFIEKEIELAFNKNVDFSSIDISFQEDRSMIVPNISTLPEYVGSYTRSAFYGTYTIRVGGRSDLYIQVPKIKQSRQIVMPLESSGFIDIPPDLVPVLKINSVSKVDGSLVEDTQAFSVVPGDSRLRFTAKDNAKFYIKPSLIGQTLLIDVTSAPSVVAVDSQINAESERIGADKTSVRSGIPLFLDIALRVSGSSFTPQAVTNEIDRYINSIKFGEILIFSEMLDSLHLNVPSLNAVDSESLIVIGTQYMPDGTTRIIYTSSEIVPVEDTVMGVTIRNCEYIVNQINVELY